MNLTPHTITVETDNSRITFEPSGLELPCDPFLVSSMILDRLPKEYSGVAFSPDTGIGAIRDDKGHIVATSRLIKI